MPPDLHQRTPTRFIHDESGAVTVDWVVLTALVLGMAIMVVGFLTPTLFENAATLIAGYATQATARP